MKQSTIRYCRFCLCGQWYNAFGQALKDPDEWEDDRFDGDFIGDDLFY